jgi:hypothetical protein
MARKTAGIGSSIGPSVIEPLGGRLTSVRPSKSPKPTKARKPPKTPKPAMIADMYERWTLDCIIEVAQAIATDFVNRPRQYRAVPPKISEILQNFWFFTSTNPEYPNRVQRLMTFSAALGPSDGMDICMTSLGTSFGMNSSSDGSQFKSQSASLRERARAYTERQVTQGEDALLQAFLLQADDVQGYLVTLGEHNNVVIVGDFQTRAIFDRAVQVLRAPSVAGVFGCQPPDRPGWPRQGTLDANGALLIEMVARALPAILKPITQNKFQAMQHIAANGADTISGVLSGSFRVIAADVKDSVDSRKRRFEPLIGSAYSWKTALDALFSS